MPAATYTITIERGADFRLSLLWKNPDGTPVNLTGRTAKMQVRSMPGSVVVIELSTANGRITLGGALGTIDLFIAAADTLPLPQSSKNYDLQIINGAAVDRLVEGGVIVSDAITV